MNWATVGDFMIWGLHNENLILKARDLGLDTLIMGIRDADKIRADVVHW